MLNRVLLAFGLLTEGEIRRLDNTTPLTRKFHGWPFFAIFNVSLGCPGPIGPRKYLPLQMKNFEVHLIVEKIVKFGYFGECNPVTII